jgi:hypothetical protein
MEAYRIDRFGSVDGIVLRSSEDPRPGLKEILMRVRASALCGLLSSALVWRTDQARLLDRPPRHQSRRNAGGIRGLQ